MFKKRQVAKKSEHHGGVRSGRFIDSGLVEFCVCNLPRHDQTLALLSLLASTLPLSKGCYN